MVFLCKVEMCTTLCTQLYAYPYKGCLNLKPEKGHNFHKFNPVLF